MSESSVHRIFHDDLGMFHYKIVKELALNDMQKEKRMKFVYWVKNSFWSDDINNRYFFDEKWFDLDGVYNIQIDRIWASSRQEANNRGGIEKKMKLRPK